MAHNAVQTFLEAFVRKDFSGALQAFNTGANGQSTEVPPNVIHLILVALRNAGNLPSFHQTAAGLLEAFQQHPWEHSLVRMLAGLIDPFELIGKAPDAARRAQACFYAVFRYLWDNKTDLARMALNGCVNSEVETLERAIAQAMFSDAGSRAA